MQPSKLTLREKFFTHPPLLPGEQIVSQQDQVTCVDTFNDVAEGILHITTYRIIFAGCYAQVLKYSHSVMEIWIGGIQAEQVFCSIIELKI